MKTWKVKLIVENDECSYVEPLNMMEPEVICQLKGELCNDAICPIKTEEADDRT